MSNKQRPNHRSPDQREIDGGGVMSEETARMHLETALALIASARGMLMHARVKFPENEDRVLSTVMAGAVAMLDAPYELMVDYAAENGTVHPLNAMIAASQSMANAVAAMWDDMQRMVDERRITDAVTLQEPKESTDG